MKKYIILDIYGILKSTGIEDNKDKNIYKDINK